MAGVWQFAPNRETAGGSSWLLETPSVLLLIDAPPLTEANQAFLEQKNLVRKPVEQGAPSGGQEPDPTGWMLFTGRAGHGRARQWQRRLGWPVLVQEQEAYLLPGLERLASFGDSHHLAEGVDLLWTPGPSPGSCVVQVRSGMWGNGDVLCCGRLLVPVGPGRLAPLRTRGTFHWPRLLLSLIHI